MTTDQQPPGNDISAICKCRHSGFEHENGDNDHICKSCNCCWSFKQAAAPTPPTSTPADYRQNSVGPQQQQQLSGNDEQKFASYFATAIKKIEDLESEANGKKSQIDSDLLNSKIEIVKDLAQNLEKEGFPVERIANEIVHKLEGKISPRHIRKSLDSKYKDKRQSANAKKQKVAAHVPPNKKPVSKQVTPSSDDEAEVPSSENSESVEDDVAATKDQQIMVLVDGTTDTGLGDQPSKQDTSTPQPQQQQQQALPSNQPSEQPTTTENSTAKELSQLQQQQDQLTIRVLIDRDELSKKIAELPSDIKNFWLCGRIENDKLVNIVLEREQPLQVINQ